MNREMTRIKDFNEGEIPSNGYLSFRANTDNSRKRLSDVKDVINVISRFEPDAWPKDSEWDLLLPSWFLSKIKSYSAKEISKNSTLLWDYGSWLDAMRFRGWEWYSCEFDSMGFIIIIEPNSFPFSVNPLEYVIYETGVSLDNIIFFDHST